MNPNAHLYCNKTHSLTHIHILTCKSSHWVRAAFACSQPLSVCRCTGTFQGPECIVFFSSQNMYCSMVYSEYWRQAQGRDKTRNNREVNYLSNSKIIRIQSIKQINQWDTPSDFQTYREAWVSFCGQQKSASGGLCWAKSQSQECA